MAQRGGERSEKKALKVPTGRETGATGARRGARGVADFLLFFFSELSGITAAALDTLEVATPTQYPDVFVGR